VSELVLARLMCIANLSEEMTFLFKGFSQWVANIEATTVDMARDEKRTGIRFVATKCQMEKSEIARVRNRSACCLQHYADCSNSVVWSRVTNLGEMLF
jgi:hypothetical protein